MATRATFTREYDGFTYVMTDEDVEWLGRSLQGECGGDKCSRDHASLVAWTEMNKFLLAKSNQQLQKWPTFSKFLQAFSQPINEKWIGKNLVGENPGVWQGGGSGCAGKPATGHCEVARVARRIRLRATAWDDLEYSARLYASAFAEGGLPELYPGGGEHFVDFAANPIDAQRGTRIEAGCVGKSCNYFYTKAQAAKYDIVHTVEGGVKVSGGSVLPSFPTSGLALAVLGAAAAAAIWYARKKGWL